MECVGSKLVDDLFKRLDEKIKNFLILSSGNPLGLYQMKCEWGKLAGGQKVIKMKVNNNNKKGKANSDCLPAGFLAACADCVKCSCPFSLIDS